MLCLSVLIWIFMNKVYGLDIDPNGYILYCPCMGRFGNQADQFLGSLGFAHALNRTLVLPAWVEYHRNQLRSVQVPFDTYFKVEPLQAYHRVLTMETFMKELAHTVWPVGSRKAFCYSSRKSENQNDGCHAKEGNPFESFWDTYNVDFDSSQFFGPLYYTTDNAHEMKRWVEMFPPSEFPVLAFTGPPAAFPVQESHVKLHKYLQWSDKMATAAQNFISHNILDRPFIGIHLRNGIDFKNACEHVKTSPSMFAAPQCIGYRSQFGPATYQMCYPDDEAVVKQLKKEVKLTGAKFVFVATDYRDLIDIFFKEIQNVKFVVQSGSKDPMLDLAILDQADYFIGNCISSFTAFVKRERDTYNKPSSFWSFSYNKAPKNIEL